ncbi:MAG: 50S ribosomal protein L4 [Candidatus Falkowbacteria bacterium]|nr:50S ribosomal protein L4 [Candidatus Falkowbacteria bacterium]
MKIKVYNQSAKEVSELEVSDKVFGLKSNPELIHQAVIAQMSNERQVLADTKDRSEVRGGGKKPWKQKGTGRARVGSSRSPLWRGGGVTFGPTSDRNFSVKINKKMKQKALLMSISDKIANSSFVALDKLVFEEFKTKDFNTFLSAVEKEVLANDRRSVLLVNSEKDEKVKYSGRNLKGVEIINLENLNILDILKYRNLIMTEEAVKKIAEQYSK